MEFFKKIKKTISFYPGCPARGDRCINLQDEGLSNVPAGGLQR
jgi:hypothetical protein